MTLFGATIESLRRGMRSARVIDLTGRGFIITEAFKLAAQSPRGAIPDRLERIRELNKGRR